MLMISVDGNFKRRHCIPFSRFVKSIPPLFSQFKIELQRVRTSREILSSTLISRPTLAVMSSFQFCLLSLISLVTRSSIPSPQPQHLNLTTITANPQHQSTLECWQLTQPLTSSSTAGTSGAVFAQLGETGSSSYGIIPPGLMVGCMLLLLCSKLLPSAKPHPHMPL